MPKQIKKRLSINQLKVQNKKLLKQNALLVTSLHEAKRVMLELSCEFVKCMKIQNNGVSYTSKAQAIKEFFAFLNKHLEVTADTATNPEEKEELIPGLREELKK